MIKFKVEDSHNKVNYILQVMIVLTLPISMISGLFAGVWMAIWALILCFKLDIDVMSLSTSTTLADHAVIIYCLMSVFWSIAYFDSILGASKILLIILLSKVIYNRRSSIRFNKNIFIQALILAYLASIIIFVVEIYSGGVISIGVRNIFQPHKEHQFAEYLLDRGMCILSISSWALIYYFWNSKTSHFAIGTYIITLLVLSLSDSAASLLAYVCSGLLALALIVSNMKLYRLFISVMLCGIFVTPICFYKMDVAQMPQAPGKVPVSHLHRLYIWKFVASKSIDRPILGHGIGSSRYIDPEEKYYGHIIDDNGRGIKLNPLPIHPHNNILQILLELGLAGLALFAFYIRYILKSIDNPKDQVFSICVASSFLTYFVIGMISFNMFQSWWMMVIILSITIMSLTRNIKEL